MLENIFSALKHYFIEKSSFHDAQVNFLGVLSENIVQCQKTFFLCLLYIYTFPIASFHFFGELIELGSKLGLQRAQFWSWLTELDFYANSQSVIYPLRFRMPFTVLVAQPLGSAKYMTAF